MNRYQIMLTPDLDEAYHTISNDLNMSMEQVLSSALQLYMERLTLECYESIANIEQLRSYKQKPNKSLRVKD